jgi:hypothetical protein
MTAQILITLTEQGCKVEGAIDNKLVAFGMLECAKEAVSKMHAKQASGIVPASAADAAKLKIAGT